MGGRFAEVKPLPEEEEHGGQGRRGGEAAEGERGEATDPQLGSHRRKWPAQLSLPNLLLLRAWGWVGGIAWGAELHPQRSLTMQSLLAQPASAGELISLNFVPTKQKPQSTFSRM